MGTLNTVLKDIAHQSVYIDTNLFIYFLDQNPHFFKIAATLLSAAESGHFIALTGDLTVSEALVMPYKKKDLLMIERFKAFFYMDDFLSIRSHSSAVFDLAAKLRAESGLKFADALHYATAIQSGCRYFITNDKGIRSSDALTVILIKDIDELST